MVESVPIADAQFRLGVVGAGVVLAIGIATFRFCGSVPPLPPKPTTPTAVSGTSTQLLTKSASSPTIYKDFLSRDAARAGVPVPTIEDMSRKLVFRADDKRHVLEVGEDPKPIVGLEIAAVGVGGNSIGLEIHNPGSEALGYVIDTTPSPNVGNCNTARTVPLDVLVIRPGERVTRVECVYRSGMALVIHRVDTVVLSPLSAWYVSHVPPAMLGIDERIGRSHRPPDSKEKCVPLMGQALRSQLETGEISWRDLVDFYARHRCQTYQFPLEYRAFAADNERGIPAAQTGM
jgi:hypothetical protein